MENTPPVLSICIPTYNRAEHLKNTLESIVSQPEFAGQAVEIIISDNASTDATPQVVAEYSKKFPGQIFYHHNDTLLHPSVNFNRVLSLAHGEFIKLHNDTLAIVPGGLKTLLGYIRENRNEKPLLFFSPQGAPYTCNNLDEFIARVSFFNTWIAGLCFWRHHEPYFSTFIQMKNCRLEQTFILCDIIAKEKKCVLLPGTIFKSATVKKKGKGDEYNIAEVFGYNYLNILKKFVAQGALSKRVYKREKKKILLKHINPFYFDIKKEYAFYQTGYFKWLWDDYKYCPYFYTGYLKMWRKKLHHACKTLGRKNHVA